MIAEQLSYWTPTPYQFCDQKALIGIEVTADQVLRKVGFRLENQPLSVESRHSIEATSPATILDALAQFPIGLDLTQTNSPGTSVVEGDFAMPFPMHYMGPVFGTLKSSIVQIVGFRPPCRPNTPSREESLFPQPNAQIHSQAMKPTVHIWHRFILRLTSCFTALVGWRREESYQPQSSVRPGTAFNSIATLISVV